MACEGCSCGAATNKINDNDVVAGCSSSGCSSGGCNRMNTYDWISALDIEETASSQLVEVSFRNGTRKDFYINAAHTRCGTGDNVMIESEGGFDIGKISLSGDLVRLQMKKKGIKDNTIFPNVIRKANERDLERLQESRELEKPSLILARAISRSLNLDMKVGDVEYQADKRKATFYYTADGRVDFRELIRQYAKEFKVKIEMRQIGARQESARVGGLGSCGRELCCSTWLTDFKSVSTTAARYQNLAINQSKLSGQCGRLKCCLNFELDSYMDALEGFPSHVDELQTEAGSVVLMKTDIFKGLMYYCYKKDHGRGQFYALQVEQVHEMKAMNKKGLKPADLSAMQVVFEDEDGEDGIDFESVNDVIDLPLEKRKKKKKKTVNNSPEKPALGRTDRGERRDAPFDATIDKGNGSNANREQRNDRRDGGGNGNNNRRDDRNPNPNRNNDRNREPREPRPQDPNAPQQPNNRNERNPNRNNNDRNREPREPRPQDPNAPQQPNDRNERNPNRNNNDRNREPREPRPQDPNAPQQPNDRNERNPNRNNDNRNREPREPRPQDPNAPQQPNNRNERKDNFVQSDNADGQATPPNANGGNENRKPFVKKPFHKNKPRDKNNDNTPQGPVSE